ncbi:phosphatidate cytidylyltransferase [Pinisolibacter sp.]|uniref:phosphatidate cytidylyltransferase n=1 Tax=Pinisolibacter sp. TaxID=2172024 RepID=UPI002FDDD5CF
MSETIALAVLVGVFLAVAVTLVGVLSLLPATAEKARALWPALISEVAIVAVALGFVVPGGPVTALGVTLLAARCGWEATKVLFRGAGEPITPLTVATLAAVAALLAFSSGATGAAAGFVVLVVGVMAVTWMSKPATYQDAAVLLVFPLAALAAFAGVAARPDGGAILLVAFLLVEVMDSAAVLGGKLFGRRPAFPRLSPRKTVEGLLVGLAAVTAVTAVLGIAVMGWSLVHTLLVAVVAPVATVAGDLAASAIKRQVGVKDYPAIHPVQGGVLDIVDAWIVTAPALALVSMVV